MVKAVSDYEKSLIATQTAAPSQGKKIELF